MDEGRDVLAIVRRMRLVIGAMQGGRLADLDVEPLGVGPVQPIVGVVGLCRLVRIYASVDQPPVGQRAVGGQPHEGLRVFRRRERTDEAAEHVVQRPAKAVDADLVGIGLDDIVGRVGAGGDGQPAQALGPPQSLHLPPNHRLAQQRPQHLARQPRRRHPRLQDRVGHQRDIQPNPSWPDVFGPPMTTGKRECSRVPRIPPLRGSSGG